MNIQTNDEKNTIPVTEDDAFSYDGYQVVRGEFFAHTYEPSFTFNSSKVSVNTACIKKLPDTDFVQILVNPDEKKLAERPCQEDEKDSFRWCSATAKRSPRQITCRIFFAKVVSLMGWNSSYRYKLLGKLIRSDNELLFVFDLTTPEIFVREEKEDGKIKASRTPSYPEEWQNQFGVPIEEHQNIQKRRNSIMNRETSLKPVLCIDLKKNRIRIHKLTLHMLGDPEYIQLLVNPQDSMIAIRKSVRKDYLAHRVRYSKADSRYCYELYSTELLQALRHTGIYLEDNRSYRIYGALNPKECLASFSMNECVLVDDMTRTEESV